METRQAPRRNWAWRNDAGFTLMEIMIVMALIVTLAGVGLSVYGNSVRRAKEATLKEDLFRMRDALDQYYADKNKYPGSLEDLVSDKYLRAVPLDPFTASAETWQTTMSELEPGNVAAEPGIYDVKSGSDQLSLDGTPYANW
jgi:general secretion pathway protein G